MNRVLVTGSSRGIGSGIARHLAQAGFDLAIHCNQSRQSAEQLQQELQQLGRQVSLLQFDVADRTASREAILADIELHGAYYGVVCNAGITRDGAFPALTEDDWDKVIHTNLDGFYNVVHPCLMPMIQRRKGGRIVTIASVSGVVGNRGQVNYSASKAGLIGASKALALELAKRKITVNCVAPGLIGTDMVDELALDELMKLIPLQRAGTVDEVAAAVAFLFSDAAGYITRQVISVNGGLV